jgi:hypothetical protein
MLNATQLPWPGHEYGLSPEQGKRFEAALDASPHHRTDGVYTHFPSDMLDALNDFDIDPDHPFEAPIWYALIGQRWSMLHVSDCGSVRDLLKPNQDWPRYIRHFSTIEERNAQSALSGRIKVYRGVRDRTRLEGWSWTTDRQVAAQFALVLGKHWSGSQRDDLVPLVAEGEVRASDVLGTRSCRNEAELIIDPKAIRSLKLIQLYDVIWQGMSPVGFKERTY